MPTDPFTRSNTPKRATQIRHLLNQTAIHAIAQEIMEYLFYNQRDTHIIQNIRCQKNTTNSLIKKMSKSTYRNDRPYRCTPNHHIVFRFEGPSRVVEFPPRSDNISFSETAIYDPMNNVPIYSSDYQIQMFLCQQCNNYQYTSRDLALRPHTTTPSGNTNHRCVCLVEVDDRSMC